MAGPPPPLGGPAVGPVRLRQAFAPLPAAPPHRAAAHPALSAIRAELEADIRRIEEENSEIDMLMEQVLIEIERHEARRVKIEERLATRSRRTRTRTRSSCGRRAPAS